MPFLFPYILVFGLYSKRFSHAVFKTFQHCKADYTRIPHNFDFFHSYKVSYLRAEGGEYKRYY